MNYRIAAFLSLLAISVLVLAGAAASHGAAGLPVLAARVPAQLDPSPVAQRSTGTAPETAPPTASPTGTATAIPSLADTPTATATLSPAPLPTISPTLTATRTVPPTRTATKVPRPTRTPTRVPPTLSVQIDPADQRVLDLVNAARAGQGLRPLRWNANLISSAGWFAGDMSSHGVDTLSHTDSTGRDAATRMLAFGYRWVWYAENIALGYDSPDAVFAGWMASEGHRANILNPNMTEIGIAHSGGGNEEYWVQDFGSR